jgi:uridylate kinase
MDIGFKRVLLKLSGEALRGERDDTAATLDAEVLKTIDRKSVV